MMDEGSRSMPPIGLGTWQLRGESCRNAVSAALEIGYRLIDTASAYGNEAEVGAGMRASSVARDDIVLVTKVWPTELGESDFQRSIENSLEALGVDAVDLLLIHWPNPQLTAAEMMVPLNQAKRRGLTRHIGVSNFNLRLLEEAFAASEAPLLVNQCEYHPYLDQTKLLASCRSKGMKFMAYSPLGRRAVLDEPAVHDIATRLGRSPAQIVLRWQVQQKSVVPIPKASGPSHLRQNFEIFGFALSPAEMAEISALADADGRQVHGEFAPPWEE